MGLYHKWYSPLFGISSLQADAFRGACLQLIQPQRSFGRMDFQTALIPSESPPSDLQSKNIHQKGGLAFHVVEMNTVKDGRTKKLGPINNSILKDESGEA
ncbi:hypothetical protein [Alteribacillus sp. HJP-4]|uniref:hypothetical protein n=1 Tax=Alteribacillus sp. HJP-4 TaxID=2775394 RepID=UPI0035CCD336